MKTNLYLDDFIQTTTYETINKPFTLLIRSTVSGGSLAFEYLEFETEELASDAHKAVLKAFPNTNAVVLQTELIEDEDAD